MLKSTSNTRAILPDSLRYIRSDVPDKLTGQEMEWLVREKITTVVDLRTEEERSRRKCRLADDKRFCYYAMPVTGGDIVPKTPDDVSKSYIGMVDTQMEKIVTTITEAGSNVLYFCNAGKDRTGVVSAILLSREGMDSEYIVADYMKSKTNLQPMLEQYARQNPEIDIRVITPSERYIREFLKWVKDTFV